MKILFDHNVPRFLRHRIQGHIVSVAAREGWDALSNGKLLAAAEAAGFDVLVTRDRDFLDPSLLAGKRIAVALLIGPGQTRQMLEGLVDDLARRLEAIAPGALVVIEAPP